MGKTWRWILAVSGATVVALAGCGPPGQAAPDLGPAANAALTDTLKARIAAAYDFSRPGVAERMSSLYPDTGRVISVSGGNVITSPDSLRAGIQAFWRNTGQNMRDAKWVWGDVYLDRLGPDAAVLTGTWTIPHIAPTGRPHVLRGAWTALFRRIGGRWMIVTEHLSSPPS
jgi:ketosteroid isomerase-like protein